MYNSFNTPLQSVNMYEYRQYDLWNTVPFPGVNMDRDDIFNTAFYGMEARTQTLLIVDDERRHMEYNPQTFLMTPRCSSPKPSRIRPSLFSCNDPIERNSFLEFGRKLRDTESTHSPMQTYVEQRIISGNMVMPKRQSTYQLSTHLHSLGTTNASSSTANERLPLMQYAEGISSEFSERQNEALGTAREMAERLPVERNEGRSEIEEFKFRFEKAMERIRGSAVNHHPEGDIDCGKNETAMLMRDRFSDRRRKVEDRKNRIDTTMQIIDRLPERITSEFDKFITKFGTIMKENEASIEK